MPSLICDLSPDQAAEWRCPYCSKGISFEAARTAGKQRIASNKMQQKGVSSACCMAEVDGC